MQQIELSSKLPRSIVDFLSQLGVVAISYGTRVYLVGGMVRDLLLDVHDFAPDIDILIEGDAPVFLKHLQTNWGTHFPTLQAPSKLAVFRRYKTAKLSFEQELGSGFSVFDFASAREERYPEPGKAPVVVEGNLESDMRRRDFSINAMAVGLSRNDFGRLYDFNRGLQALNARELAVMHEQSFYDDPARLLRGVRLQVRLGLEFSASTKPLFDAAVADAYLARLPRARLYDEFLKALDDEPAAEIVAELAKVGILGQIHPYLASVDSPGKLLTVFEAQDAAAREPLLADANYRKAEVLFCVLFAGYQAQDHDPIFQEFQVPRKKRDSLQQVQQILKQRNVSQKATASRTTQ